MSPFKIGQSRAQVLQINGRLCHLVLAFPYVGDIANGRAPLLRGHYSASLLLRTQPPPSRLRPTSRFRRLYGLPCSDDFAPGRGGLPASSSRTKLHAFTHGTSCPSLLKRTSPKCP